MQRTQIRIVSGSLRGRKIEILVHEDMRPTPQMVREALFSILGNAVPNRPFYDIFAGTGINGMEAISRGASNAVFVELSIKLANDIEKALTRFNVLDRGQVVRTDVYRWSERWMPISTKPVNLFLSPPFPDLTERRNEDFVKLVTTLIAKMPVESVITIQFEEGFDYEWFPSLEEWDIRRYGRNMLAFWVKESPEMANASDESTDDDASDASATS